MRLKIEEGETYLSRNISKRSEGKEAQMGSPWNRAEPQSRGNCPDSLLMAVPFFIIFVKKYARKVCGLDGGSVCSTERPPDSHPGRTGGAEGLPLSHCCLHQCPKKRDAETDVHRTSLPP